MCVPLINVERNNNINNLECLQYLTKKPVHCHKRKYTNTCFEKKLMNFSTLF